VNTTDSVAVQASSRWTGRVARLAVRLLLRLDWTDCPSPGRPTDPTKLDGNCGRDLQRYCRVSAYRLVLSVVYTRPVHILRVSRRLRCFFQSVNQ